MNTFDNQHGMRPEELRGFLLDPSDSLWMDVKEAAAYLGNVSPALVYRLFDRSELIGGKIAGRVKLKRSSVEAYLRDHSNEKAPTTQAEALHEEAKKLQEEVKKTRKNRPSPGFRHLRL